VRWLLLLALAGCHEETPACTCAPTAAPDEGKVLALVRKHRSLVGAGAPNRDVKLIDDELRFALVQLCSPCGTWVQDRMTVDEMLPLGRADEATGVVCLGLVLRDGTTAYGKARTCR
jgi:hypothetical protein